MAFLDDLGSFLGMPSSSSPATPAPASGGMTNYGAAPSAQGISAQSTTPTVLARLKSALPAGLGGSPGAGPTPGNPLGLNTPIGGNDLAIAMSGLSQVRPGAGKFSAFAQGLAGAMGARANANFQGQELAQKNLLLGIEAAKAQQAYQLQQQTMAARVAGANALNGGGAPAPQTPMQLGPQAGGAGPSPAPAPAIAGLPAGGGAPPPPQGATPAPAAPPAGGSPVAAPDPSAQAPKMIPHAVAAQPDFWSTVAPDSNPAYLDQQASQYEVAARAAALDPETAKRYGDTANQYRQRALQIRSNGMVTLQDGSSALIPGFAASKATAAAAQKAAEQSVIDQHEMVEAQPTPGGPTVRITKAQALAAAGGPPAPPNMPAPQPVGGAQQQNGGSSPGPGNGSPPGGPLPTGLNVAKQPDFINQRIDSMWKDQDAMTQQYHARQDAIGRLQQMQQILPQYETGNFADQKANAIASLKAIGVPITDDMQNQANSYQEFQKLATKNVFNDVKSMGGRVLVSEIEGLTRANANPNLQPGANQAILGSAIGALNRENQYYTDFTKWHGQNPTAYDASGFEQDWNKNNPAIAYAQQGIKDTPAKGIAIPPPNKLVDGQQYVNPKGQIARWNASAGHFELVQ